MSTVLSCKPRTGISRNGGAQRRPLPVQAGAGASKGGLSNPVQHWLFRAATASCLGRRFPAAAEAEFCPAVRPPCISARTLALLIDEIHSGGARKGRYAK
jgi:hypothetical protein